MGFLLKYEFLKVWINRIKRKNSYNMGEIFGIRFFFFLVHSMWDLNSPTRDRSPTCVESVEHWTARKVPGVRYCF